MPQREAGGLSAVLHTGIVVTHRHRAVAQDPRAGDETTVQQELNSSLESPEGHCDALGIRSGEASRLGGHEGVDGRRAPGAIRVSLCLEDRFAQHQLADGKTPHQQREDVDVRGDLPGVEPRGEKAFGVLGGQSNRTFEPGGDVLTLEDQTARQADPDGPHRDVRAQGLSEVQFGQLTQLFRAQSRRRHDAREDEQEEERQSGDHLSRRSQHETPRRSPKRSDAPARNVFQRPSIAKK